MNSIQVVKAGNFATSSKLEKPLAISKVYFVLFAKFFIYFCNFLSYWANFNCCKWPIIERIIQPSGHTGWMTISLLFFVVFALLTHSFQLGYFKFGSSSFNFIGQSMHYLKNGPNTASFCLFYMTNIAQIDYNEKAQMVCLGREPGRTEWQAQTNPLSYGSTS